MDTIPLINPKLIKVSATTDNTSRSVLRAEVVSSTPIEETSNKKAQSNQQQEYKVVLQVGKQQLETVSTNDLKKGSQIDVKILPGPELRIINKPPIENQVPSSQLTASQTLALQAKPLVQQLLADRTPQLQQQDLPNLIKQLSQIINQPSNTVKTGSLESKLISQLATAAELRPEHQVATKPTNQQVLANKFYQQQTGAQPGTQADTQTRTQSSSLNNTSTSATVEQLKTWIQQLPKGQDIASSTGLRNALNNAGIQAETQLSDLAQQSLNLPNKKSANSIFQQLQTLQKSAVKDLALKDQPSSATPSEAKPDLAAIIKKTAKTLSDNSQQVLSNLIKTKAPSNEAPISTLSVSTPLNSPIPTTTSLSALQWQNPLLNNAQMTLEDLLQAPLLQNPSSNNKFALSQILTGHTPANKGNQSDGDFRIPMNWHSGTGNGAGNENALIRNLQNLLGHIEREQIQQMQTTESNQANNPNQLQQNQQWIPLLINHQQQLQLIEFFLDKEERIDESGEKKQHWFINLHFELPKLGKLGIEICMFDNECSTTFWSESASSLSQLTQHIQPLRERLTEQGIVVSDIQSRHGTLEKRKHNIQQRLIDVKT